MESLNPIQISNEDTLLNDPGTLSIIQSVVHSSSISELIKDALGWMCMFGLTL